MKQGMTDKFVEWARKVPKRMDAGPEATNAATEAAWIDAQQL
jgi:hypothetical protein